MKTHERIKKRRKELGLTADFVATQIGVSRADYYKYESAEVEKMPSTVLIPLAKTLKCTPSYLIGWEDNSNISEINDSTVREPIYAEISCGTGSYEDGEIIGWISLPSHMVNPHKKYFGNVAKGDSMTGAGIFDGDILIFEVDSAPEDGQIGSFCIDEDLAVCKRFKRGSGGVVYLMSANDAYPPITIDPANTCFRMVGLLAFVINDRRDK